MIRSMKLILFAGLVGWVVLSMGQNKPNWISKFNAWCCRNLGYGCKPAAMVETRNNEQQRPKGGDLMTLDLKTHQVLEIWKACACWSPIPIDQGTLEVVSEAGIWAIPVAKPQNRYLAFKAGDIIELLGAGFTSDRAILFLRLSKQAGCKFEPWVLQPDGSSPAKAALSPELDCGTDFDFQGITKPAQVSDSGKAILITLLHHGKFEINLNADGTLKPLFPESSDDDVDRFDPVWIGPSSIAFIRQ